MCYNYCLRGQCYFSLVGQPQCKCPSGFTGSRCEYDVCDSFCLNGGVCSTEKENNSPSCSCPPGYFGNRCEMKMDFQEMCDLFCQQKENGLVADQAKTTMCR